MTQTARYFSHVKWYRQAVEEITGEYNRKLEDAARFKGSAGYDAIVKEATAERDNALRAERQTAHKAFSEIISTMRANVANRKTTLPTPEQAALLTILKSRTTLTRDDIKEAANSLKDCPAALAALHDIAKEHKLTVHVDTGTLPASYLTARIDSLEYNASAMLDGQSVITKRVPESEGECMTRFASLGYELELVGDSYMNRGKLNQPLIDKFSSAVNGTEAEGEA